MQQMWREVYERFYLAHLREPNNEDYQWWLTKEEDILLEKLNHEFEVPSGIEEMIVAGLHARAVASEDDDADTARLRLSSRLPKARRARQGCEGIGAPHRRKIQAYGPLERENVACPAEADDAEGIHGRGG